MNIHRYSTHILSSVGLTSLLLLPAYGAEPSEPTTLIISTDNAAGIKSGSNPHGAPFDDFLVIMQAMNEPAFDVTLIAAVFNNYMTDATYFVSRYQVEHHGLSPAQSPTKADKARADRLVYKGATGPLLEMYGASGDENPMLTGRVEFLTKAEKGQPEFAFDPLPPRICSNDAVKAIAGKLDQLPEPETATILAIGALTDVACLVDAYPEVVSKIREVVYLGGRYAGWYDEDTYETAVENLNNHQDAPNSVNYLIEMLDCPEPLDSNKLPISCRDPKGAAKQYFQPLPDSNTNSDFPGAYQVLKSKVPVTIVVGPLAQQVTIDYDEIGKKHSDDHGPTLLTRFLQQGAKERGGQRDVIAWDSTAFNYLLLPDVYACEIGNWQFVPCQGISKPGEGSHDDICLTHREPDFGGWTSKEYYQLWVGNLEHIKARESTLDIPDEAQRIPEDRNIMGVTRPSTNTVRVCYNFTSDKGWEDVAARIQDFSY